MPPESLDEIYRTKLTTMVRNFVHEQPAMLAACFREAVLFQTACMAELFKLGAIPDELIVALEESIMALGKVEAACEGAFPGGVARSTG
jgi:hypothetical protein